MYVNVLSFNIVLKKNNQYNMKAIIIDERTPIFYLTVGDFLALIRKEQKTEKPEQKIPEVFGINKLQEITGYSKNTIYAKTSQNKIPHFKRDNRLFFKAEEIMTWLTANPIKTSLEYSKEMDSELVKGRVV